MPNIPGTLATTNTDPATTATASGADLLFIAGQVAKWSVTPAAAGDYWLRFSALAPYGGKVLVKVDGVQKYSQVFFNESEEDETTMPAHSAPESTITAPTSGSASVRADVSPPANRYRVRLVNTHPTARVHVSRAALTVGIATYEIIEADGGVWEDYLDSNCTVYVRSADASLTPTVRVIQYATA